MKLINSKLKGFNYSLRHKNSNLPHSEDEEDSSEDDSDDGSVISVGNRIYFYSEVHKHSILSLNKKIKRLNAEMLFRAIESDTEPSPIFLHINSYGGSAVDGLLGMDIVSKSKIPIYTIVEGVAASAATLISVAGHKRCIHENSLMMIHQLSTLAYGTYANLEDEMENCRMIMEKLRQCYQKYTKIPLKKLEKILQHDLYFSSEECLKNGLVDEII